MPTTHPVIVVPGITAAYLRDFYPLPPETIWAVIRKDYARASLHPDDPRFEAREPALVRPDQLYEIVYRELVEELRFNLSARADDPVPVYPFSYDWRQPLARTEDELAAFIDEVIDRTALMRNYHADPTYRGAIRVNLVGHSMGGLVIAGYLERFGADKVHRIATLGTPFRGSFEALIKMVTGTADLGGPVPSSREREAARLTPALYHLLPGPDTGIERERGARLPRSPFNPAFWQPSIVETIAEYIRLHGRAPPRTATARSREAKRLFRALLALAAEHRARIEALDLAQRDFDPARWLAVVGVDAETRVAMRVERDADGAPVFRLRSRHRMNLWRAREGDRRLTGDGTVPFRGAVPGFLPYESLVCVSPRDLRYWEIGNRVVGMAAELHGILPTINMVHRLLVRHLTGAPDRRGNTWGRRPPGVGANEWRPPVWPLRDRSGEDLADA